MKKVFVIGGLGSGKSSVMNIMNDLGVSYSIDLDSIAAELVSRDFLLGRKLVDCFGEDIQNNDGSINRASLAKIVFSSQENIDALNEIMIPIISEVALQRIKNADNVFPKDAIFTMEVQLPNKAESIMKIADEVILISTNRHTRINRACKRGMYKDDVISRINFQISDDELRKYATVEFGNNGTYQELKDKFEPWFKESVRR